MTINGISGTNTQMGQTGMNQAADSYSRSIQRQIADAQKQLQELSSNEDMALEEKMKKRQEIQQQISDLNAQLRQHQIEQRKEKQQEKGSSMDDMLGGTKDAGTTKAGKKGTGLSQAGMTAMISADSSMKQAKVQGGVATSMEGRAGVLESEIKLDGARGSGTASKEEELAEVKQKAVDAAASQISTLADANKTMADAAQADNAAQKAGGADAPTASAAQKAGGADAPTASAAQKAGGADAPTASVMENGSDGNVSGADAQEETISGSEHADTPSDASASNGAAAAEAITPQPPAYTPVDIRL